MYSKLVAQIGVEYCTPAVRPNRFSLLPSLTVGPNGAIYSLCWMQDFVRGSKLSEFVREVPHMVS